MATNKLPAYVFRGTTISYPGNVTSINNKFCCTSENPVKALWFAMECMLHDRTNAVIYIADTTTLKEVATMKNVLNKIEEEIAFNITPARFYKYCKGYIAVNDFQKILSSFGIDAYQTVRKEDLSRLCKETKAMPVKTIKSFVVKLAPYIKKA